MARQTDAQGSGPIIWPGEGPGYLGDLAADLLSGLCEQPPAGTGQQRRWISSDYVTFSDLQWVELTIPHAQAELKVDETIALDKVLNALHAALPYSEAERIWLHRAGNDPDGTPNWDRLPRVRRQEAVIVSSGVRQVVYGRELLRRWWSWRREADEFSGQGTLDPAREALRELVEAHGKLGLPEEYKKLRGID
jgi:hypothetical protein